MSKSVENTIPVDFPEDRKPWERWPHEPAIWFGRFTQFRELGSVRTIMAIWENDPRRIETTTKPNPAWYQNAKKWRWIERADLWDADQYQRDLEARELDRARWKKTRSELLDLYSGILKGILNEYIAKPNKMTMVEISTAVRTLMDETRKEFGDPTDKRILELTGKDGKPVEFKDLTDEEVIKRLIVTLGLPLPPEVE